MRFPLAFALWSCLIASALAQSPPPADSGPSPTKILETAVHGADSRIGIEALKGLRAARDPSLRPLFSWLAAGRTPMQRHHGVLGLAEIETPPHLNPLMLSRVADHVEQAAILGEAIANDLVRVEEIEQILAIPKLDPYIELVLRARLAREGKPIDIARITALSTSGGMPTELLASVLLAQAGKPEPMNEVASRLLGMSDPDRGVLVGTLLQIIRREKLSAATPLLARLERVYSGLPDLNADLLRTWLRVAPDAASPVWTERFTAATAPADRLRLALAAIDASDVVKPDLFAPIEAQTSDPVLASIGRAGRAIASRKDIGPTVASALSIRYNLFENWAAERAAAWAPADAATAYRAILTTEGARLSTADVVAEAVPTAAAGLGPIDPAFVNATLDAGAKRIDEHHTRAILTGLLRGHVAPVWNPANPPRWPDATSAAIAVLIHAASVAPTNYPAANIPALQSVAAGHPALLPPGMRAQAAWILAKINGEADPLLARLLAGE